MSAQNDTIVLDHLKLVLSHLQTVQNQLDSVNRRFSSIDQDFAAQTRLIANLAEAQSQAGTRMSKIEERLERLEQSDVDRRAAAPHNPANRPEHFTNVQPLPHQRTFNGVERHRPVPQGYDLHSVYGLDPRRD